MNKLDDWQLSRFSQLYSDLLAIKQLLEECQPFKDICWFLTFEITAISHRTIVNELVFLYKFLDFIKLARNNDHNLYEILELNMSIIITLITTIAFLQYYRYHGDVFPSGTLKFTILSAPNAYILCNTKEYSLLNKSD